MLTYLTPKGRESHGPLSNLFFDDDHFAPFIVPTVGADTMRQTHFAAIAALYQVLGGECIMGAPAITAGAGMFFLG
jgi:hypothetical protein